jgi:hypothetical protein
MKFKILDTVYDLGSLDRLSLIDILMLEKETRELGNPLRWSQVMQMSADLEALKTKEEKEAYPDILWMSAITIWSSRRIAGDKVSFVEAIDFPMGDMIWLPDPEDHKEPERPTKPARARAGSGRATKRPVAAARTASQRTSQAVSTVE